MTQDWKTYFIIDSSTINLFSLKHEMIFIMIGSFYMFLFSPYILNSNEAEFKKAIGLPEEPSLSYLLSECEHQSIIKNIYDSI